MDRRFRPSFSNLVARLHMSFILQKNLDDVALRVKFGVVRDWPAGIALRWNDSKCALINDLAPDLSAAVSFVRNDS